MSGADLFEKYMQAAQKAGRCSPEAAYLQTLRTAYYLIGPEALYALLEEAQRTGQVLELTLPIPIDWGPSDPNGVKLVQP